MVKVTKLKSGIRVVTDTMKDVDTVSLFFSVSVGSRFEEEQINGISHLLEHMAFKGTKSRTALQIAEEIENVGGVINAYTSKDVTAYYVKVLKQDVPLALSILSDILQNSMMIEEELEKEKGVVIQEIGQTYDAPDEAVFEYYQSTAYPKQPFGRSILGSAEKVKSISRKTLLSYMRDEYTAPRVVVSAAGNITHDYLVEEVEKALLSLKTKGGRKMQRASYVGGEYRENKKIEQVNLVLGFEGIANDHPLYYAQNILATILGGGMSSRLFQEIREKRGLVYSIYAFSSSYQDTGDFGIFAGTGEKQVSELLPVVCDEILKVASTLKSEEIERAKAQLRAHILMKRESTSARAESNARHLVIYGRVLDSKEIIKNINAVDENMLKQTAEKIFFGKPTLSCLGPIKHVMPYEKLVEALKK
ncbi:MAG: insulinase family protein [Alphaproteobacteria bacterium]|nr:insulinase family protein [Alphaproteobacteria bacterium]